MTLEAASDRENNSFGLLRLLAALAVVVSHAFYLTEAQTAAEPLYAATGFTLGQHAVHAFFVMSGFMVAASLDRLRDLRRFAAARVLRIVPGLAVCVVASVVIVGPLTTQLLLADYFADRQTLAYLVKTLVLASGSGGLPGVFADNPVAAAVNIPIWTLKYEIACYAILMTAAAFGLLGRGRGAAVVSALLLAGCIAIVSGHPLEEPVPTHVVMARFLLAFWIGVTAFAAGRSITVHAMWPATAFFLYAAAFDGPLQSVATVAFTAVLTLWLGARSWPLSQRLTTAHDLSYGVYIYGWPVSQSLIALGLATTPLPLAVASLALLLPLALLSWHLVERPALRLLSKPKVSRAIADDRAPAIPDNRLRAALRPPPARPRLAAG